jgi:hypothetical protein
LSGSNPLHIETLHRTGSAEFFSGGKSSKLFHAILANQAKAWGAKQKGLNGYFTRMTALLPNRRLYAAERIRRMHIRAGGRKTEPGKQDLSYHSINVPTPRPGIRYCLEGLLRKICGCI